MKFPIFIILLSFTSSLYSQNKSLHTYDRTANKAVENVNFIFNDGTNYSSDKNGKVILKTIPSENVKITHIAYETINSKISSIGDTLFLHKRTINLNEIVIYKRKTKIIHPKKSLGNLNPRNYGTSASLEDNSLYATYIPNGLNTNFYVKSITLEPTDFSIAFLNKKDKIRSKRYKN